MATIYNMAIVSQDETSFNVQERFIAETGYWMLAGLKLKNYFKQLISGIHPAAIATKSNVVYASGAITFSSIAAADTVTVAGQVYTCVASGATGTFQFNVGANDTAAALNLVAAIQADPTGSTYVTASSLGAVITITAYMPGALGNLIQLGISLHGSVSTAMAGGTNGDQERTHYYGSRSTF